MTCQACKTEWEEREFSLGDRRVRLNLCLCRAEKIAAKYRKTKFGESDKPREKTA